MNTRILALAALTIAAGGAILGISLPAHAQHTQPSEIEHTHTPRPHYTMYPLGYDVEDAAPTPTHTPRPHYTMYPLGYDVEDAG